MKHTAVLGIAATAALCSAAPAFAQANRTFVSGSGSDANPCSLSAPCRSFAQALTQTNPGGEIAVLDTAGYGQVTIDRAVSIVNQDGVEAGVTATTGDGITVAAGASDAVTLRGLTVVGLGGENGITYVSGRSLNIDKCEIRGFTASGISMQNTAAARLTVTDTTVSNNFEGVFVDSNGAGVNGYVTLTRLHASENGATGVSISPLAGSVLAYVVDSLLDNNGTGLFVTTSTAFATVIVENDRILASTGPNSATVNGANSTVFFGHTLFDGLLVPSGLAKVRTWGNNQSYNPNTAAPTTF